MTAPRKLEEELRQAVKNYPVAAVLGPRQSGKTTLIKSTFPDYRYVLLEDRDIQEFALSDPRGFLDYYRNENGLIIDEAQHAPELFSYIQGIVDEAGENGMFILTGSQNFYLSEKISQSLAGRVAILTLLPFSLSELQTIKKLGNRYESLLFQGAYPRIHLQNHDPRKWYQNYIQTYIERDVRSVKKITDLHLFQKFLGLCAGRIGHLVNFSELGRDCGISTKTVTEWLSLLEASFIIFFLQPYHVNFNKRLVKSPKLFFYDTGVACSLLKIHSEEQLMTHYLKGNLFESFIISELKKQFYNVGELPDLYFWRDSAGHEIDGLLVRGQDLIPIEVKSGKTINNQFFSGLNYWNKLANRDPDPSYLVYGGTENQKRTVASVLSWQSIGEI